MDSAIEHIKTSSYKWMIDPVYVYEFHSGREAHWNPHIHICVTKLGHAPSQVRQVLERSPAKKKTSCYNVNVVKGQNDQHLQYVQGNKHNSKDKCIVQDQIFRAEHKIKSYYTL